MLKTNVVEKIKIHIFVPFFFPPEYRAVYSSLLLLLLYFRLCLFFQRLGRGSFDETSFPAFLRPVSTAHFLWTTISRDLCQTVVLHSPHMDIPLSSLILGPFNPYPTAFPSGNGMVLHFYQQQESSTTKTVHKVINKGLKTYV